MASISKLAVIISGHTKPLEDSMKKAESKVKSFGHSFKEGAMLGAGVMGIDKLEQAMKKAVAGNEELAEAAEKAEESFGKILLKVTGIGALLPKAASTLEQFSKYLDSGSTNSGFSFDLQVFKEQAASLLMSSETRAKELGTMRAQWEEQTKINNAQAEYAKWQKDQAESQKKKEEALTQEMETYSKSLSAKIDSLDPLREELRIAEQLKSIKDPFLKAEIELRQMRLKELEQEDELVKEMIEDVEEYYRKLGEAQEFSAGPITKAQADLEKQNSLIEESRKLIQDQIPDVEKWAKKFEEARQAFLGGSMSEDEYRAVSKEYGKAMDESNKVNDVRLSGAASAGSEAAYSIIANAQASRGVGETANKQLETQISIDKELKKQTELHKSRANGAGYIALRALTLGGS